MPESLPSPLESDNLLEGLDPKVLFSEGFTGDSSFPEVPGFEILAKLGEGGMGLVYRAWQESLQREVALKLVRSELVTIGPGSMFDRLEREAQAMAQMKHPHIVGVHDFIRFDDETVALVLELIEGETLRALLERERDGLPMDVAIPLIQEIGQALQTAHEAGLVHRDVKPENVLIDLERRAHVTDFGLALPTDEDTTRYTRTGTTVGTIAYLAPEQLDGAQVDVAADQFSFAVVIYEMLTGVRPRGVVEPPHELRKAVHPSASRVLLRAMSRKPEGRYDSVSTLVSELIEALKKPLNSISRRTVMVAAGSLGACGVAGVALWANRSSGWIDLLENIDVEQAIKGAWIVHGDGSVSSQKGLAILPLPISPNDLREAYEVKCEIVQTERVDGFGLCFQNQNGFGAVEFNNDGNPGVSGIQKINGLMLREGARAAEVDTAIGRSFEFRLRVIEGTLAYFVGNDLIQRYELAPSDSLHILWNWDWNRPQEGLALASLNSPTTFRRVLWRPLSGA